MGKKITIIGAGGKMGQWFAKFFSESGFEVTGYDSEVNISSKSIIKSESLVGSILNTDYVILCTPTRRTPEIIRLIAKEMKRGTYLIEISSQKSKTITSLSKMPSKINPICIHPMFGPGTKKIKGKNIISIPVKDAKNDDVPRPAHWGGYIVIPKKIEFWQGQPNRLSIALFACPSYLVLSF